MWFILGSKDILDILTDPGGSFHIVHRVEMDSADIVIDKVRIWSVA